MSPRAVESRDGVSGAQARRLKLSSSAQRGECRDAEQREGRRLRHLESAQVVDRKLRGVVLKQGDDDAIERRRVGHSGEAAGQLRVECGGESHGTQRSQPGEVVTLRALFAGVLSATLSKVVIVTFGPKYAGPTARDAASAARRRPSS